VSVLVGSNDGTFTAGSVCATGDKPAALATGDFNEDGILDLAAANHWDDDLSVLLGDGGSGKGNGDFLAKVDYPTGQAPVYIAGGDFNADGISDLAVANFDSHDISILLGDGSAGRGDGSFTLAAGYPATDGPSWIIVGDFDADGISDLAAPNQWEDCISAFLGNGVDGRGDGSFASKTDHPTAAQPFAAASGDFNRDGILDLATANRNGNNVSVLLGLGSGSRGNGTFGAENTYPTGSDARWVSTGDFNRDGIRDLAVANFDADTISVLLGQGNGGRGDGTFGAKQDYPCGEGPNAVVVADLDDNGTEDLAAANWLSGDLGVFLGQGDGTFASAVYYPGETGLSSLVAGDLNLDGIEDIAAANHNTSEISVFLGQGTNGQGSGTFAGRVGYPTGQSTAPLAIVAGDFNADGILDLATANNDTFNTSVLIGSGDGSFTAPVTYVVSSTPRGIATGDFNADGILDLAVASAGGSADVLLGQGGNGRGNGTFGAKSSYHTGPGANSIILRDFNTDGILDLAVTRYTADEVVILTGNGSNGRGNGTFGGKVGYPAGIDTYGVAADDFNADGILDLATANARSNDVSILPGRGECLPSP
jgi:hypothetical protein